MILSMGKDATENLTKTLNKVKIVSSVKRLYLLKFKIRPT